MQQLRLGTHHHHVAMKRSCGITVQLHDSLLSLFQQSGIDIVNCHVNHSSRGIYYFRE